MSDTTETQPGAIIAKVREYNLWRRGSEQLAQPDPTEIGLYLDTLCDIAERLERERDEARAMLERRWHEEGAPLLKMMKERDEARRLLATAKESLNAIHVEVGGWIATMINGGK